MHSKSCTPALPSTFLILAEYILGSTFAEHLRLDGGLERKTVRQFLDLQKNVFHFLAVGEELLHFTVLLDRNNTAVITLLGLDARLEILDYDREVHKLPDRYNRTGKTFLAVFRFVSDV